MAAINFRKEFAALVKSGKKRCTMRQRRKNGYVPAVGECLALYTGMRSKGCEKLNTVTVKAVRPVIIELEKALDQERTVVVLDGKPLSLAEIRELALRDGFSSVAEFRGFFRSQYGTQAHLYLIEW